MNFDRDIWQDGSTYIKFVGQGQRSKFKFTEESVAEVVSETVSEGFFKTLNSQ